MKLFKSAYSFFLLLLVLVAGIQNTFSTPNPPTNMKPASVILKTAPAEEPVSLIEAKAHCRISVSSEDDLVTSYIKAARQSLEEHCQISFIETTWLAYYHGFPDVIELPKGKVTEVVSVMYLDENGANQNLNVSDYKADLNSQPATIEAVDSWPDTHDGYPNTVYIEFKAGISSTAAALPDQIKVANLLQVGALYDNREDKRAGNKMPRASELLVQPYRVMEF